MSDLHWALPYISRTYFRAVWRLIGRACRTSGPARQADDRQFALRGSAPRLILLRSDPRHPLAPNGLI